MAVAPKRAIVPCTKGAMTASQSQFDEMFAPDGSSVEPGQVVAEVTGPLAPMLSSERVALNLLQRMSGVATIRASSPDTFSTMGLGVPAGATRPYQLLTSKPGRPASLKLGTSGTAGERACPDTASALSRPLLM